MTQTKVIKPGINQPLICKKCGHRVGTIRIKPKLVWKNIRYGILIALTLETIANVVVYLIFRQ